MYKAIEHYFLKDVDRYKGYEMDFIGKNMYMLMNYLTDDELKYILVELIKLHDLHNVRF